MVCLVLFHLLFLCFFIQKLGRDLSPEMVLCLYAVGFTVATTTKAYLRPDPVDQNKKGVVDSVNLFLV